MGHHSTLISIWLQVEFFAMAVIFTKAQIRCYCDAPYCVTTGYMCKSDLNACFTKVLEPFIANSPQTHGCLDPVVNASQICSNNQMSADVLRGGLANTLQCCHNDMCNYKGLHDFGHTKGSSDQSHRQPESNNQNTVTQVQEPASAKEMWFWAAVIAVPIAGGLILGLLIMMALQMLRSENKRLHDQRQQMLSRLHYSLHGHHAKKRHVAKPDLEYMVPITGHENCYLTCDRKRQVDLDNDTILSLVQWGMYSGHDKQEFV